MPVPERSIAGCRATCPKLVERLDRTTDCPVILSSRLRRRAARCQRIDRSESRSIAAISAAATFRDRDAAATLDSDERRPQRTRWFVRSTERARDQPVAAPDGSTDGARRAARMKSTERAERPLRQIRPRARVARQVRLSGSASVHGSSANEAELDGRGGTSRPTRSRSILLKRHHLASVVNAGRRRCPCGEEPS
jgi:hypothetical protein